MKFKIIKLVLCFFALTSTYLTNTLFATELSLELMDVPNLALENEKTAQPTVFIGTPFRLKVVVKNGQGEFQTDKIEGLNKLHTIGRSRMDNTRIMNGAVTTEQNHILNVVAQQEGSLTIGPAIDDVNGNVVKSNTVQFRVVKRPADTSKIKTASGEKFEDDSDSKEVSCEILTDKKNPFEGEPIMFTLRVTVQNEIANLVIGQMNFSGLSFKEIGQQQVHQELQNNKLIEIVERKYALTALQPGIKTVNPVTIGYQVRSKKKQNKNPFGDAFFSGFFEQFSLEGKRIQSNSLKIDVKPLPQTNDQVDGIGVFKSFEISTDKTTALTNEAIALTLSIEGNGNFDQISTPKLQLPDFIKNYESKNNFNPNTALGSFGGKKTFEYIIQISKPGSVTIPAQKFIYFDTNAKTYKTLNTNEVTLSITQPAGEQAQAQTQMPIQESLPSQEEKSGQISRDIGFIEETTEFNKSSSWSLPLWLLLFMLALSVLFMFNMHKSIISIFTKSHAFRMFNKKSILSKFQKEFESLKKTNAAEKIYGLFLYLLAAKFDSTTQSITSDFIEKNLLESGWDTKRISNFIDYLNKCAELHFITTKKELDPAQTNALFKNGQYWIMLLTNQDMQQIKQEDNF